MQRKTRFRGGFSLIELMIVIGIVGILVRVAIPKFVEFRAKAKQTEAKSNLNHIRTLVETYVIENGNLIGASGAGGLVSASAPGGATTCNDNNFCVRANGINFNITTCQRANYQYSLQIFGGDYRASATEHNPFAMSCFPSRPVFTGCPGANYDRWTIDTTLPSESGIFHAVNGLQDC